MYLIYEARLEELWIKQHVLIFVLSNVAADIIIIIITIKIILKNSDVT